uniref:Uncharacterized protein n=1 Tax=Panagrolaimus davidi TaxID=227884 RepID=A0A914Q972_9BILA
MFIGANSCGDLNHDIETKCPKPDAGAPCSELQDYINCARDVVEEDCGDNATVKFCDTFNAGMEQIGNPCNIKCTVVNAKA